MLDKKQDALRERVEQEVVTHLGWRVLGASTDHSRKGGTEYRWFWLGACYLNDHLELDRREGNYRKCSFQRLQLIIRSCRCGTTASDAGPSTLSEPLAPLPGNFGRVTICRACWWDPARFL